MVLFLDIYGFLRGLIFFGCDRETWSFLAEMTQDLSNRVIVVRQVDCIKYLIPAHLGIYVLAI